MTDGIVISMCIVRRILKFAGLGRGRNQSSSLWRERNFSFHLTVYEQNALSKWRRRSAAVNLCVCNVMCGSQSSDRTGQVLRTIILINRGRGVGG